MNKISVKSTSPAGDDGGFPIAIYDKNPAYKGGELFIGDNKTHVVPLTAAVAMALNDGRLEQVGGQAAAVVEEEVTTDDAGTENDSKTKTK